MKKLGTHVRVIGEGETVDPWAGGESGAGLQHAGRQLHPQGHRQNSGVGYVISAAGRRIDHAGDTDLIPEMRKLGPVDVALLPIGGTYTMDLEEAVRAARVIAPRTVIPIHHLRADPGEFKARLEAGSDIRVRVLEIGEEVRVADPGQPDMRSWIGTSQGTRSRPGFPIHLGEQFAMILPAAGLSAPSAGRRRRRCPPAGDSASARR